MQRFLTATCRGLGSLLSPTRCPHCDRRVERSSFPCPACEAELDRLIGMVDSWPPVERLLAAAPLEGVVRTLIHRMKYQGHLPATQLLGRMMVGCLLGCMPVPRSMLLVPVPLHRARLRQRGFNQAERLARRIAGPTALTVRDDLLERNRWEGSQTSLELEARRSAVAGAFRVRRSPPQTPLLLVDDVWTTGATADACRAALLDAGALEPVRILVAARTPARLPD